MIFVFGFLIFFREKTLRFNPRQSVLTPWGIVHSVDRFLHSFLIRTILSFCVQSGVGCCHCRNENRLQTQRGYGPSPTTLWSPDTVVSVLSNEDYMNGQIIIVVILFCHINLLCYISPPDQGALGMKWNRTWSGRLKMTWHESSLYFRDYYKWDNSIRW